MKLFTKSIVSFPTNWRLSFTILDSEAFLLYRKYARHWQWPYMLIQSNLPKAM